jgi:hypothetical protein
MSSQAPVFTPVIASGIRPPEEPVVAAAGLVLGPWVIRRAGASGPGGALISRRENFIEPTLILARRRRTP